MGHRIRHCVQGMDQFDLTPPHLSFDAIPLLDFNFPKLQYRRRAEKPQALYLLPSVLMRHVIEARI